ncbi:MAG: glycosyltransferase family 2 protein [Eubacteriales bacterium]|nr:glycosyltransferase family 2 protein [Eubacteriales bacterium]
MTAVTVIVPVYRAEAYLGACIESILNQTFSDFALILVDDGSPDRCGEICEAYSQKDSRIRVLHQENQGQSAARNHALAVTDSPWVSFVDSDDLIHPRMLELLYRAAREGSAGVSMCRMLESPSLPDTFLEPKTGEFKVFHLDDETLSRMYREGTYPAWVSCGKLIRRELVQRRLFCPGRVYEDNEAVCRWLAGEDLAQMDEELYFYRTNPESTTKSAFSMKKLDFLWALESITGFYGSMGFATTRDCFFDRWVRESAGFYRVVRWVEGNKRAARAMKRTFRRFLRSQGSGLTKPQLEEVLDAMHPRLIRLYWPMEGLCRTLRQEGLGGLVRKLRNHRKRGE